jgi:hypothetical protein
MNTAGNGRSTMAIKTMQPTQTTRRDSITLDSWNNILFLAQEPNRHGETVWNIRLILGDLPPWRYGQFTTKAAAMKAFAIVRDYLADALWEHAVEAGNRAGCDVNEEY